MVCKGCGAYLPKGAKRCSICGWKIPASRGDKRRKSQGTGLILALVTVVVLLVAVIAAVATRSRSVPDYSRVLDRYFTSLEQRDAQA